MERKKQKGCKKGGMVDKNVNWKPKKSLNKYFHSL